MTWGNPNAEAAAPTAPVAVKCEHPACNGANAVLVVEVGIEGDRKHVSACFEHSEGFNIVGVIDGLEKTTAIFERLEKQHAHSKAVLQVAKDTEMNLRKLFAEYVLPSSERKEGVNNVDVGGGRTVKITHNVNYKLVGDHAKIEKAEADAAKVGNEGAFLIERIITWTPDFSKSEYNKLQEDNPTHVKVKKIVDDILTTDAGAPKVEVKEPKATLNG